MRINHVLPRRLEKARRISMAFLIIAALLTGCAGESRRTENDSESPADTEEKVTELKKEQWKIERYGTVYVYLPDDLGKDEKVPLVLDMNCTTGNPEAEVLTNGWDAAAAKYRFIVVAPTYNDYATYSEADYMISVIDEAISRYNEIRKLEGTKRYYNVSLEDQEKTLGAWAPAD